MMEKEYKIIAIRNDLYVEYYDPVTTGITLTDDVTKAKRFDKYDTRNFREIIELTHGFKKILKITWEVM